MGAEEHQPAPDISEALRESMRELGPELAVARILRDELSFLRHDLAVALRDAVTEGITAAAHDQELVGAFFTTGITAIKAQARGAAGNWMVDTLFGSVRKYWLLIVLMVSIYWYAGWSGVKSAWATLVAAFLKG